MGEGPWLLRMSSAAGFYATGASNSLTCIKVSPGSAPSYSLYARAVATT